MLVEGVEVEVGVWVEVVGEGAELEVGVWVEVNRQYRRVTYATSSVRPEVIN